MKGEKKEKKLYMETDPEVIHRLEFSDSGFKLVILGWDWRR